jgi:hypothetical protein
LEGHYKDNIRELEVQLTLYFTNISDLERKLKRGKTNAKPKKKHEVNIVELEARI